MNNLYKMREFYEDGKILSGEELCEINAGDIGSNFIDSKKLLIYLVKEYESANHNENIHKDLLVHEMLDDEKLYELYDTHIAEGNADIIKKWILCNDNSSKLLNGKELDVLRLAEIYFAERNNISDEKIQYMIENSINHKVMRDIRKGFEAGLDYNEVSVYAGEMDHYKRVSLMTGLKKGVAIDKMMILSAAKNFSTIDMGVEFYKKGMSETDVKFLLYVEKRIMESKHENGINVSVLFETLEFGRIYLNNGIKVAYEELIKYIDSKRTIFEFVDHTDYNVKQYNAMLETVCSNGLIPGIKDTEKSYVTDDVNGVLAAYNSFLSQWMMSNPSMDLYEPYYTVTKDGEKLFIPISQTVEYSKDSSIDWKVNAIMNGVVYVNQELNNKFQNYIEKHNWIKEVTERIGNEYSLLEVMNMRKQLNEQGDNLMSVKKMRHR